MINKGGKRQACPKGWLSDEAPDCTGTDRASAATKCANGVALADAGYDSETQFRNRLTEWELSYGAGIQSAVTVSKPGEQPRPASQRKGRGRPPKLMQRDAEHQPVTVQELPL
jgi:SRSO17 transposase